MSKAIFFDMDGTLFQTNTILEHALNETFNYLRKLDLWSGKTPIEKYREIMGVTLEEVWNTLLPEHDESIHQSANKMFHTYLIENIKAGNSKLYPNVEDTLRYLQQKDYLLFIASNGQVDYLHAIVSEFKLNRWLTNIYSIQQIKSNSKSDLVAHIKGTHLISEGAVVGDRLSDINAGKDNLLKSIGCNFDFAKADELLEADIIINDLFDITKYY